MDDLPLQFQLHIPVIDDQASIVALLADASGLSKQVIKQTMQNGAVWLSHGGNTRRVRRTKQKLTIDDEVHLYYDQAIQATKPGEAQVIVDEGSYSVLFKPSGMYSQGSKWGDHCTIYRWAERHFDRSAFIVHRLDRAACGLILIAHQKTCARMLSSLFEQRQIKKTYRALVSGQFSPGTLRLDSEIDGRPAVSFASLKRYDSEQNRSLLEVDIETGRKHQIRRHLADAGYPIVGDRLYGRSVDQGSGDLAAEDLQLIAYQLAFIDPDSGERREYLAPDNLVPTSFS
ncbi:MAG: RluA family pseudouridine synthase [Porticoccaceae bacterium]|nr:RluA family pseudouridine synthase [Porticoccaceae bacterium]